MGKKRVTKSSGEAPAPSPEKQAKAARKKRKRDFIRQLAGEERLLVFFKKEIDSFCR